MEHGSNLSERLRDRVVSALHVGHIRPGDRLPGIREVARETGANPRTVARIYRALEDEGLVEIRGRSGVYVARQDHWGERLLVETGRWLGGVLQEAWKRSIPIPELPELIRGYATTLRLRAGCIDGNADQRRAIRAELEGAFGIACAEVAAERLPADPTDAAELPAELADVDLVVTTPFHSGPAKRASQLLGKPLVIVSLHPDLVAAVERRLEQGALTVICIDPVMGEKVRQAYAGEHPDRVRVVLADDADAVAGLDPAEPVLLTRAAQERLGSHPFKLVAPHSPYLSPESAREISELMIRLHLESRPAPP